MLKSDCAWRLLPHDFSPWRTVYHYFRAWRLSGPWERMHSALRERVRVPLQRNPQPSARIGDSQSVKTTGVGGQECGYDGAKKIKGRKRHLLVDTQGLVLIAKVNRANVTDRDGITLLLDLLVAISGQEDEQGLREAARELGSVYLRGYESPDGEEIGPLVRVFRQVPNGVLGKRLP